MSLHPGAVCAVRRCVCLCVCVWRVCECVCVGEGGGGGGGLRVCLECVCVLPCPFTLHIPTCSHINYKPLPTRVCVCSVSVRGVHATIICL